MQKNDQKLFSKNSVMSEKYEERLQSCNKCCIWEKLFDAGDNKVRHHCNITGKYWGSAHWSCNNNLALSKRVLAVIHKLPGCGSHLIMQEIGKFDLKVND